MDEFNNQNNQELNAEQSDNAASETVVNQENAQPVQEASKVEDIVYLNEAASVDTFKDEFGIPRTDNDTENQHGSKDSFNTHVYGTPHSPQESRPVGNVYDGSDSYQIYETYDTYDTNENYRTEPAQEVPVYSQDFTKKETKTKRKRRSGVVWAALLCIILSLISGFAGAWAYNKYFAPSNTSVIYESVNPGTTSVISDVTSLADVIDRLKPSVVEVQTEVVTYGSFFGQSFAQGAGSGVVLTSDGYIVTNFHVIKNANSVTVTMTDGKKYDATVIGYDEEHDVAVIKIDANDLTPAVIGDSSTLRVGDTAIAIGNPLGTLGGTVTTGIVS
ncbi:MAG: trypsin-like peptidase domain-containing protein, partial [Oscillospiraceae bacterium]|nr:trypsin-like peptidase domain-containing protein [Oscillospiraceae bacterium]